MVDNRPTLLTEQARRPEELGRDATRRPLEEALALPATDLAAQPARAGAVASGLARLRLGP